MTLIGLNPSPSVAHGPAARDQVTRPQDLQNTKNASFHSIVPESIVPGAAFSFTVVNLSGQVVPNQTVTIDGGPNGSITATTDLHGMVVAKAPETWKTARVLLGTAGVAMLADKLLTGGGGTPTIQSGPTHVTPGSIMNLRGIGFSGNATNADVHVGDKSAVVLASSPTAMRVLVPTNVPLGETAVTYTDKTSPQATKPATFKVTVVSLRLEANATTLHTGQRAQATLIVEGTQDRLAVAISAPQSGTIRLAKGSGTVQTSGGTNNRVTIPFTAISVGQFDIRATLPKTGDTDYEKDLTNAEAARRDAAGWRDSSEAESDENVATAKRLAAGQSDKAAADWDAAAEARKHGDDKKAAAFEDAAKAREESSKAYGADRDPGRGAAAAKDAGAKEETARSGG